MILNPITYTLILNASILIFLAVYFALHRAKGSGIFALLMLASAIWAIASAFENSTNIIGQKIIWSKMSYLGIVSVTPLWLIFSFQYTQYKSKITKWIWYCWLFPLITLIFVATNEFHGLIWPTFKAVNDLYGLHIVYGHGPMFYFTVVYSYIFLITGVAIFIQYLKSASRAQRVSGLIVIFGMMIPWLANFIYSLALPNFFFGIDLTPVAMAITGAAIMLGVFKYRFLALIPAAKEMVYQNIEIGIIVINGNRQIVDLNDYCRKLLSAKISIGKNIKNIKLNNELSLEEAIASTDVDFYLEEKKSWLNLKINDLKNQDEKKIGEMLLIRDITEQKQAENLLRESQRFFSNIVDFLPDPSFVINHKGEVIIWNKAMEKLTGVMSKDIIGKGNYEHSLPFYKKRRPMLANMVLIDNQLDKNWKLYKDYEITREGDIIKTKSFNKILNKNGVYLMMIAQPLLDNSGQKIYAIESVRDISDIEKYDETMKEKIDELSRVNEIMVNRELKMIELKNEIENLKKRLV